MLFNNAKAYAQAVKEYAINNGKQIKLKKCESNREMAVCKNGYKWTFFALKVQNDNTLQVKTFVDGHTCNISFVNS